MEVLKNSLVLGTTAYCIYNVDFLISIVMLWFVFCYITALFIFAKFNI
jgi:hypothetical protein